MDMAETRGKKIRPAEQAKPTNAAQERQQTTQGVSAPIGSGGPAQDVVVRGKPVQNDTGTVSVTYNPGPGDPEHTEVFGKKVKAGESVDVPAKHADKIAGNPYLSTGGKKDMATPSSDPEPIEELSFEEELARERSTEYLEGQAMPPQPPGEADRLARAIQAAAELKASVESDDTDKPKGKRSADQVRRDQADAEAERRAKAR
jgi:hypothetical protein